MRDIHNSQFDGHPDTRKILQLRYIWWPSMKERMLHHDASLSDLLIKRGSIILDCCSLCLSQMGNGKARPWILLWVCLVLNVNTTWC